MEKLSGVSSLSAFLPLKSHSLCLDSKAVGNNRVPGGVSYGGAELFQVRTVRKKLGEVT